jgi:hypothetical protein
MVITPIRLILLRTESSITFTFYKLWFIYWYHIWNIEPISCQVFVSSIVKGQPTFGFRRPKTIRGFELWIISTTSKITSFVTLPNQRRLQFGQLFHLKWAQVEKYAIDWHRNHYSSMNYNELSTILRCT